MLKKIFFKSVFTLLIFFSFSLASENFFLKFHKLKINSYTEKTPIQSGKIRGNVDSYPYGFNYYVSSNDGKIPMSEMFPCFESFNVGKVPMLEKIQCWKSSHVGKIPMF